MLAPQSYVQTLSTVRRKRKLPVDGKVLVELGDEVKPDDVIARASLSRQHLMLDASQALSVPIGDVKALLQRRVGEKVEKGAILAGKRRIGGRLMRAPADGRIVAISGGQILMQVGEQQSELRARIPGKVVEIEPNRGASIELRGSWLQGLWGNGRLADGEIVLLTDDPRHTLIVDEIDMNYRGAILVGGHCSQRQALELANEVPVRGLVLGSIAAKLIPLAREMNYPILLSEGFGKIAMNAKAFELLESHVGDEATLNARERDDFEGRRPEIIIPQRDVGESFPPKLAQELISGQLVRGTREPHQGVVGEISSLLPSSTLFESGVRTQAALVRLSDGSEVVIPLANLEILV
jgi:hypothetical protein